MRVCVLCLSLCMRMLCVLYIYVRLWVMHVRLLGCVLYVCMLCMYVCKLCMNVSFVCTLRVYAR